ncbi:hypothetical protein C7M84_020475 [Penaeus vannamei]|uniref:Uncharacterized protein n=1 Tax=Penaeus vannamei TaxID=6689 RepID=A0A423SC27_PENVA|nr:hypothetical protein C7M84_020475 [Penaeus vannamei]
MSIHPHPHTSSHPHPSTLSSVFPSLIFSTIHPFLSLFLSSSLLSSLSHSSHLYSRPFLFHCLLLFSLSPSFSLSLIPLPSFASPLSSPFILFFPIILSLLFHLFPHSSLLPFSLSAPITLLIPPILPPCTNYPPSSFYPSSLSLLSPIRPFPPSSLSLSSLSFPIRLFLPHYPPFYLFHSSFSPFPLSPSLHQLSFFYLSPSHLFPILSSPFSLSFIPSFPYRPPPPLPIIPLSFTLIIFPISLFFYLFHFPHSPSLLLFLSPSSLPPIPIFPLSLPHLSSFIPFYPPPHPISFSFTSFIPILPFPPSPSLFNLFYLIYSNSSFPHSPSLSFTLFHLIYSPFSPPPIYPSPFTSIHIPIIPPLLPLSFPHMLPISLSLLLLYSHSSLPHPHPFSLSPLPSLSPISLPSFLPSSYLNYSPFYPLPPPPLSPSLFYLI